LSGSDKRYRKKELGPVLSQVMVQEAVGILYFGDLQIAIVKKHCSCHDQDGAVNQKGKRSGQWWNR
jgi:hypothetical protein